ncbi:hypothetical protein [Actinomycetospora chiangmaiensis]|uniref:hypothetical protein n=1 Tax=Actinomycetospora chiangmaiensis TaxID=402650 RepID=UPI0003618CEE|nr:hypothetical protein [Actinomycetospora chiangmaiensis]
MSTVEESGAAVRRAYAQLAATAAAADTAAAAEPAGSDTTPMTRSDVVALLEVFGESRRAQGDTFTAAHIDGHWFYETGAAKTGLVLWGEEDDWTFSAFSAARVKVTPTLDLHRRVGMWRSSVPQSGCYVIEDDGDAAVMCEREIKGNQVFQGPTAWRLIRSVIDAVGMLAVLIDRDLDRRHGIPFTLTGDTGLVILLGWWEIQDRAITRFVRESG